MASLGWFGPKHIGIGARPRRWQGWLVTGLLVAGMIADAGFFHPVQFGLPEICKPVSFIVLVGLYLAVIALTYDSEA